MSFKIIGLKAAMIQSFIELYEGISWKANPKNKDDITSGLHTDVLNFKSW